MDTLPIYYINNIILNIFFHIITQRRTLLRIKIIFRYCTIIFFYQFPDHNNLSAKMLRDLLCLLYFLKQTTFRLGPQRDRMFSMLLFPANTKCWADVGLTLGHHFRQCDNIKPAFAKCLVYTGQDLTKREGESDKTRQDEVPSGQVAKFCLERRRESMLF